MMVNVSDARRELVHVRASETSTIINSKHESLPTGCLSRFLSYTHPHAHHQINQSAFTKPHIYKHTMNIIPTDIQGVLIIEPRLFRDARGYFFESFSEREFDKKVTPILGHKVHFCQDNESMSSYGVMRGLHFQRPPYTQSKLVRCIKGRVLDVAVDIRKGSPTYGQHVAVELTEDNHRQFFIPRGFAHGFAVLSETAVFQYKCDEFYHPEADGGISILDDTLHIDWRIPTEHANLSDKDTKHAMLADFDSPFDINVNLYE